MKRNINYGCARTLTEQKAKQGSDSNSKKVFWCMRELLESSRASEN